MNCNEAVRLIPDFLNDELDGDELEGFIGHIEECSECMEELTIMSLVTDGLNRLEDGLSYNVNEAVKTRIDKAHHIIRMRRRLEAVFGVLAISAAASVAAGILIYTSIIGF